MKTDEQNRLLKIVRDNYQEIAGQFNVTRKKHGWPELEELTKNIESGDNILDVGCGNGRLLDVLVGKKINYLGVDNSQKLIEIAKKNYPNFNFLVADILELTKVINKKFDYIILVAVFHHLPGQELRLKAFSQLKQLLSEDGQIIFSVWRLWNKLKYRKYLIKTVWQKIIGKSQLEVGDILFPWKNSRGEIVSERYYHAFTKRELKQLLNKAGFKNFKLYSDKYNYWVVINK